MDKDVFVAASDVLVADKDALVVASDVLVDDARFDAHTDVLLPKVA